MTDLATSTIDPVVTDTTENSETSHGMERAPRGGDDIEQVAIETVRVGDYVVLDPDARSASARCVVRKRAKANERTAQVVGWLLDLTGGQLAWWPRGGLVWRRRLGVHS